VVSAADDIRPRAAAFIYVDIVSEEWQRIADIGEARVGAERNLTLLYSNTPIQFNPTRDLIS